MFWVVELLAKNGRQKNLSTLATFVSHRLATCNIAVLNHHTASLLSPFNSAKVLVFCLTRAPSNSFARSSLGNSCVPASGR